MKEIFTGEASKYRELEPLSAPGRLGSAQIGAGHGLSALEQGFRRELDRLAKDSHGILVGYSGGADSTALLHLLKNECTRNGIYLAAVHVNHGIRGVEADRDEAHCKAVCKRLGIELHILRADIPALAAKTHKSLEEAARDYRYAVFAKICAEDSRLDTVATAHNADDNAETLLFNLARGTGIAGLSGIPSQRLISHRDSGSTAQLRVIRPLLFAAKREILEYCEKIGADYIFDSTNSDTKYTRNYIRSELIPRFTRLNSAFLKSAARLCTSAGEDSACLEALASDFLRENSHEGITSACSLAKAPRAISKRALRLAYERLFEGLGRPAPMLEANHIDSLLRLCVTGGELSLPGKVTACVSRGELELTFDRKKQLAPTSFGLELRSGINRSTDPDFAILAVFPGDDADRAKKDNEKLKNIYKLSIPISLKSDIINGVLSVRSRKPGDFCVFGGMTRRLKVLYNGAGLTDSERRSLPLVCDDDGILWIPGFPVADRARCADDGQSIRLYYYRN